MTRLLAFLLLLCVIAPALMARGGQMTMRERGSEVGALAQIGAARIGIELRWRVLA